MGRGPGLEVYVFGGRHKGLPLEPGAGRLLAAVLVEHRISAVLAIKDFSTRERARFVTDFAHELLRRNTEPLHPAGGSSYRSLNTQPSDEASSCAGLVRSNRLFGGSSLRERSNGPLDAAAT